MVARTLAVLFLALFPAITYAQNVMGRFEAYCDGFGFFLTKVDGAPAGRVFLFLRTNFPGLAFVPKNTWKDVSAYRNGCIADGKCKAFAHGKIKVDEDVFGDLKLVFGNYDIELDGQHLSGKFTVRKRNNRHPPRICM